MAKKVPRNQDIGKRGNDSCGYSSFAEEGIHVGRGEPDIKKSHGHIHKGLKDRVAAVKRLSAEHDIKLLCRLLKVSRSTYYATIRKPESTRCREKREYCARIKVIWKKSRQCYGSPKIAAIMRKDGVLISQKRVGRLMAGMGIRSVIMKKYRHHSSAEDKTERKSILNQEFGSERPNERWATDITYIKTRNDGWTYLASVVDLCTKRIVGFKYAKKIKEVTKSIDNIVEMIMASPSSALAKKLSELEQDKERLNESYQEVCKTANIKQLDEEEITKMFRLARNQLEVGTLKMTKVLVETLIDKVIVYKDRIEVVFNFCKDVSITQEIEDIVNFKQLREGCEKKQQNASDQGQSAILCDGGNTPLASTKT